MKASNKLYKMLFIMVFAGLIRIVNCYWGYPYRFHQDEPFNVSITNGKVDWPEDKEYILISSLMFDRYYAEPERFSRQIKIYDSIRSNENCIYKDGGTWFEQSIWGINNILNCFNLKAPGVTGSVIEIYSKE